MTSAMNSYLWVAIDAILYDGTADIGGDSINNVNTVICSYNLFNLFERDRKLSFVAQLWFLCSQGCTCYPAILAVPSICFVVVQLRKEKRNT